VGTNVADTIAIEFSFALKSSRPAAELQSDRHFMSEMRKVGLKILGLSTDRIGWIQVTLTVASGRRLGLHSGRKLTDQSTSISVDYTARIPKAAVEDVSIASDPAIVTQDINLAIQNAENASGTSYGVTVDSSSVNSLTSNLDSTWTAAVAAESGSLVNATKIETTQHGFASASHQKKPASWTLFAVQIAIACFATIVA